MSKQITSFDDVFGLWLKPRLMVLAMNKHLDKPLEGWRLRNWKVRGSIPPDYLKAVALAAKDEGYEDVTYALLKSIYAAAHPAPAPYTAAEFS